MARFHNPYHFVPVKGDRSSNDMPVSQFRDGEVGHMRHDRYEVEVTDEVQQRFFSGRIVCRLTTEDPVVIGNKQERNSVDEAAHVSPFELYGKPAIPATTLRGLISSIAEAASNSALRVLEDKALSYRMAMDRSMSAIGMIVEVETEDGGKELRLRPLALPTMHQENQGIFTLPVEYRKMFPLHRNPPPLKVYVGDFDQIRRESFVGDLPLRSFSMEAPEYYFAKLNPRSWGENHTLASDQYEHFSRNNQYLLSQKIVDGSHPVSESNLPPDEESRSLYTRGILRILGVPERPDIPATKKHELFIPYPEDVEKTETFPILSEAITRFHKLADGRTEARKEAPFLPYEPRGTRRNLHSRDENDHNFRLKHGDLVYFRPNDQGTSVAEMSFSSIWRCWAGSSYDYFRLISKEKLPFQKGREYITIAEQLLGFVEQRKKDEGEDEGALALASRLRFSFGILHPVLGNSYYEEEITLKILDSPKPPLPSFYFKYRNGQRKFIATSALHTTQNVPQSFVPQGRKFYLHKRERDRKPWRTEHEDIGLKQKSRVQPIKAGISFYFHIDFDNLSYQDLALLCYALRPSVEFRHKIGMGKPLGLGKVRIDPVGIFFVDRYRRYHETSLFDDPRYHEGWIADGERLDEWPDTYAIERKDARTCAPALNGFEELRQAFRANMDGDIRHALELLGNPLNVKHPVHTPQVAGQDLEINTYQWFVNNQEVPQNRRQFLIPLTETDELPTLDAR